MGIPVSSQTESLDVEFQKRLVRENWESARTSPLSLELIENPVLLPCAHILDKASADQILRERDRRTHKCLECRTPFENYFQNRRIEELSQQGDNLLQRVNALIAQRDGLKAAFVGDVPYSKKIQASPSRNYEMLIPCGHVLSGKVSFINRVWHALFSCKSSLIPTHSVAAPRMNEYVQAVEQLEAQAQLLEEEIAFLQRPSSAMPTPSAPPLALLKQTVGPSPQIPIKVLARPNGLQPSRFTCNRPWTPLEPAERLKDPQHIRRKAFKNTIGNDAFLSYVRVNAYEDGRIEIFLSSVHKDVFEQYLKDSDMLPDTSENRTTLNFDRTTQMGVFKARTQAELEWALAFIGQNVVDGGTFPEEEHIFLTQLVESSANWRTVEASNKEYVTQGINKYLSTKKQEWRTEAERANRERRMLEEIKSSDEDFSSSSVPIMAKRFSKKTAKSNALKIGFGVAVLAIGIFAALNLNSKQIRHYVSIRSLRNLTQHVREGFRKFVQI